MAGFTEPETLSDTELLSKIEKDSLGYFIRMSDKVTGLTRDSSRPGSPASIAATGFALAAVAIGGSRGWIDSDQAYEQLRKTLKTLLTKAEHEKGFFYHFLDGRTGRRVWTSEASSIDTALLVAGALLAGKYYPNTEIDRMAQDIYRRVDWKWMLNNSDLVCMGWTPESGFLPYYWDSYNEHLIIQALAIGSPTYPIPAESWNTWFRNEDEYNGKKVIYSHSGSLFTYQFAQAFIDFKLLNDRGVNYAENSKNAAIANREYSLSFRNQFKGYSEFSWGLSASIGPGGYKAYGAKPGMGLHDGTIAPYAVLASIVFTPQESITASRFFFEKYQDTLYGIFGFKDAFNLGKNWWSYEYLGIDQGITVLMLENFLNQGAVWEKFMELDPIERWVTLCGLKETLPS
ncbi:MAG: hypothetical protein HYZ84_02265 [Candidatus Omnitrophica bacterium]|nr:hypothetical protein [Candidatus Omnitrophota bacterium]